MGSGNGKNKVKHDPKGQNITIPLAQNQKNYNAVQNFKRKIDEEFQSNSQSESDQKSASQQHEISNLDLRNQKPNLKRFSISQQIQLSKKEEYRINNSLQIFVNKNNETGGLLPRKQPYQINNRSQLQIPKQKQYLNKLQDQEEEEEEEKQIDFRAAVSEQSYEGDKKSVQNSIQAPGLKIKQKNHFNNLQINGSGLFKSTRKIQTVNNFTEDYTRDQKKLLLQSMKNLQKANRNDNDDDTSSYQSSAYSKSSPKSKKVSSNSPQQKTSCMNTPLSLKKIQLQKGNHTSFSRDKLKKFSQKTVKELLDQNIFKIQNSQKENFETEQDQDTTSLHHQINQKQENWIHASISKISSSPASEKFMQESNHSQQQFNGNKQYQQLDSLDSQNQNIIDERNTLATSKILQKSNEVTSQTLKTRQELDNPITSHASESTFKKHAHLKRDKMNQEITSLQDIQNDREFRAFQNDESQQEQDMLQSKRIVIRPASQVINSYRNIQSQNSLQEKDIEEDSTELKNIKLKQYQNSEEYQMNVEENDQEEEDEEYLDDGNDQENENVYNNFIDLQNSQKKRLIKDEGLNIEQNYELQEVEELNDSLLTAYDIGYIDFNNHLKSHDNEDQVSNELKNNKKQKKQVSYLSNDLQQKVKRVYVRSVLQQMQTLQYYGQKNFKFEIVSGEVQQAAYFQKQKNKYQDIQKKDQSQSEDSDSEQQERIIPNISAFAPKKFRVVGGTMYDQEFQQNNQLRNAVSDMEDSQLFINRKKYIKDLDFLSKFGVSVCCRKGNKEEDIQIQSDYIYYRDRLTSLLGVFDGHGPYGYQISNIAYKLLITKFLSSLNSFVNPELALKQIYRNLSKDINKVIQQEGIVANQFISGISCTFIVRRKNNLLISHVGDTKAFVFKKNVNLNKKDKILAVQLTEDHTPNNTVERNRIYREHGEVKRSQDFSEKVFVRGRDYPAIHITRSIGDLIAQQIGVISEPYIKHYDIDVNDSYLLIGTSGLFDLINTEEIWQVISPFEGSNILEASKYLQSRVKQLKKQHPQMCQDITFVLQCL
ncbi:hypothetical protein ABPG74_002922 [Tetrahymena malaccensis]